MDCYSSKRDSTRVRTTTNSEIPPTTAGPANIDHSPIIFPGAQRLGLTSPC